MKNGTPNQIKYATDILNKFAVTWVKRLPSSIKKLEDKIKRFEKRIADNPDDEKGLTRWKKTVRQTKEELDAIHQVTTLIRTLNDAVLIIKMRHAFTIRPTNEEITIYESFGVLYAYDRWLLELHPMTWLHKEKDLIQITRNPW